MKSDSSQIVVRVLHRTER